MIKTSSTHVRKCKVNRKVIKFVFKYRPIGTYAAIAKICTSHFPNDSEVLRANGIAPVIEEESNVVEISDDEDKEDELASIKVSILTCLRLTSS